MATHLGAKQAIASASLKANILIAPPHQVEHIKTQVHRGQQQGGVVVATRQQRQPAGEIQSPPDAGQAQTRLAGDRSRSAKADFAARKTSFPGVAPYRPHSASKLDFMLLPIGLWLAGDQQRQRLFSGLCQRCRQTGRQADQVGFNPDTLAPRLQIDLATPGCLPRQALVPWGAEPGRQAGSGRATPCQNLHLAIARQGVDAKRPPQKMGGHIFCGQAVAGEIDVATHLIHPRQAGRKQGAIQQ